MFVVVMATILYNMTILTPIMIILIALLDDIPVILIAYDHALVNPRTIRWQMPQVLISAPFWPCSVWCRVSVCWNISTAAWILKGERSRPPCSCNC